MSHLGRERLMRIYALKPVYDETGRRCGRKVLRLSFGILEWLGLAIFR